MVQNGLANFLGKFREFTPGRCRRLTFKLLFRNRQSLPIKLQGAGPVAF